MKRVSACVLFSSVFIFMPGVCLSTSAAQLSTQTDSSQPTLSRDTQVTVNVLQVPSLLIAENKQYLVYEIFLTNFKNTSVELTGLDIKDKKKSARVITSFDEAALTRMMTPIGVKYSSDDATIILPGMQKILYMWLPFDEDVDVPNAIRHVFTFQPLNDNAKSVALAPAPMPVNTSDPVIVGAPLRGDNWVAGNGPSNSSEHRRAYNIGDGIIYFSQRYAIDFVKIGANGLTFKGDISKNASYYSYQSAVYSVASGRVIAVRNDIPENTPNSGTTAVAMDKDTASGNYVFVDIGDNHYALYAHLIPGSIQVKPGDRVAKGQTLGKLGNSGNSSEPHLHFHITDGPDIIYANGITYGFEDFSLRPSQNIDGSAIQIKVLGDNLTRYRNQSLLENGVVKFPD